MKEFLTLEAANVEINRLRSHLAACYRLTGADPDGNEEWRLAEDAVKEVKELRDLYDELCWKYTELCK